MNNLVSIVIPVFNSEDTISETIDCLLNQSYQNWEAICVDDGSMDHSIEVINRFALKDNRIKVYSRNRMPKGGSVCRNIGIDNAKGDFIIFLDSDDVLIESCLENRVKSMLDDKSIDFSVFPMLRFNKSIGDTDILAVKETTDPIRNFIELESPLPWTITSPIWKRETLLRIGKFNEHYPRLQDPEMHLRALLSKDIKYKCYYQAQADCYYRNSSPSQLTKERVINVLLSTELFIREQWGAIGAYDQEHGTDYKKVFKKTIYCPLPVILNDVYLFPHLKKFLKGIKSIGAINEMDYYRALSKYSFKILVYTFFYPVYKRMKNLVGQ